MKSGHRPRRAHCFTIPGSSSRELCEELGREADVKDERFARFFSGDGR